MRVLGRQLRLSLLLYLLLWLCLVGLGLLLLRLVCRLPLAHHGHQSGEGLLWGHPSLAQLQVLREVALHEIQ